jgi:hypothetical protein
LGLGLVSGLARLCRRSRVVVLVGRLQGTLRFVVGDAVGEISSFVAARYAEDLALRA